MESTPTRDDAARAADLYAAALAAGEAEADRLQGRDAAAAALAAASAEYQRTSAAHLAAKQAVYALADATPNGPRIVFPEAAGIARFAFDPTKGKPEDWSAAIAAERAAEADFTAAQRAHQIAATAWRDFRPVDPAAAGAAIDAAVQDHLTALIDSASDLFHHLAAIEALGARVGIPRTMDGSDVFSALKHALPSTAANVRRAIALREHQREAARSIITEAAR